MCFADAVNVTLLSDKKCTVIFCLFTALLSTKKYNKIGTYRAQCQVPTANESADH